MTQWLPAQPTSPDATIGQNGSDETTPVIREFRLGLESLPYLADHGFHDMAVLPGAFYIELVRQMHREVYRRPATSLRDITFEKPVILSEEVGITIRAQRAENAAQVTYEVFESTAESLRADPAQSPAVRLSVDWEPSPSSVSTTFLPEILGNNTTRSGSGFYADLRANGNQYGPAFHVLDHLQQVDTDFVAQIAAPERLADGLLPPPLLDAVPQLLAAFTLERGKTFILKSIAQLTVMETSGAEPHWARAVQTSASPVEGSGLIGQAEILDRSGAVLCMASGVSLAYIDPPSATQAAIVEKMRVCVASTFTAESLEDPLKFWGDHFERPVNIEFAPYNQVFQQLLNPTSAFHHNRTGINFAVLALEDWLHESKILLHSPDHARAEAVFGPRSRTVLPNGLEISHLNRYETDYVYQEIFGDLSYLRHDIQLADGNTVIDIGANIGLFSLFVMSRCRNPSIYAFEPSPHVFDLLRANCAAYGDPARVKAFNAGVAEKKGTAQFTFYQHSSVFSSFHPDAHEDRAAIEAVVRNVVENEMQGTGEVSEEDVQALTTQRLDAETIDCPLTSVSDIIRENGLQKIHLLKIDAEKSEIGILRGIAEEHWPMIEQIVMEIHDRSREAVEEIGNQLEARGFRCAVVEEKFLQESGLFNIYATRRPAEEAGKDAHRGLNRKVDEFCAALDSFAAANPAPLVLAVTPPAELGGDPARDAALEVAEQRILARAAKHAQIRGVTSQSILQRYPVAQLHDAHSHQIGHVPFTTEGFAALGTALSRAAFSFGARPVKVIALDCDNTLWAGTCGEDGPEGISIPAPFRYLQEFVVRQSQAGVLLALCSKNEEADVQSVFALRTEMPLRLEHIAASQINWESKPSNLRVLAKRLNLGLESFVFLDDNPVECAAVRAGCPEVTVLQLPADSTQIPPFLESLWIFDHATVTREDRERSEWYRTNAEREEMRGAAPTLQEFLDGLQLRIDITDVESDQIARVSQLTLRTNQFNLTSKRRSESELQEWLSSGGSCLVTTVADRFGDYGLVGAILYRSLSEWVVVDTMLLSCRALGKGVEHRMLSELGQRAIRDGKTIIELSYGPTERNEPARAFIEQFAPGKSLAKGTEISLEVPASVLAVLRYVPEAVAPPQWSGTSPETLPHTTGARHNLSAALQRLGEELSSADAVARAIEAGKQQGAAPEESFQFDLTGGADALEHALEAIWKKALGRASIGHHENFFDAGGTSLQAVGVVAMIRRHLNKNASIVALFESPTISLLAARLRSEDGGHDAAGEASAASAESRGRQRKIKLVKRKTASA